MMANTTPNGHLRDEIVEVTNPTGDGNFVIVCEHASNFIPPELHNLGLDADLLRSHIAWDPGALEVARAMAAALDAPLVAQRVSRLVYDCNRDPAALSAIAEKSEIYDIPGNAGLNAAQREARAARYHAPFHDALAALLNARVATGRAPALITVHSFTPVYEGVRRALHLGVIHDTDARLADALLGVAGQEDDFVCRRNAPYAPEDGVTFTLVEHAVSRGLLNVMLEIRNDLIADSAAQQAMAKRLTAALVTAAANLDIDLKCEAS